MTKKILLTLLMGLPLTSYGGRFDHKSWARGRAARAGTQPVVAAPVQQITNEEVQINTQTNPPLRLQVAQPIQNQGEQKAESTLSQISVDLLKLSGILNQLVHSTSADFQLNEESRAAGITIAKRFKKIISSGRIEKSADLAVQQETLKEAIKSITDEDADAQQAAQKEIEKALSAQNDNVEGSQDDRSAQPEQISAPNTVPTNIMENAVNQSEDAAKQAVDTAAKQSESVAAQPISDQAMNDAVNQSADDQQENQAFGKNRLDAAQEGSVNPPLDQDNQEDKQSYVTITKTDYVSSNVGKKDKKRSKRTEAMMNAGKKEAEKAVEKIRKEKIQNTDQQAPKTDVSALNDKDIDKQSEVSKVSRTIKALDNTGNE